MKYLKYIIGIIVILVVGFLLLGVIKPKLSYECVIMVDKPIAESWAITQDKEKMSEWLSGFQRIEHVSGVPGTVGAISNVHFDTDGQKVVVQETITDLVPNESMSMSFTSDFMDMDYYIAMTSINGKTKISSKTTAVGNGMFSKSIMVLIGNSIKAQEETNLSKLKKAIEKNTKNYLYSKTEINN